MPTVNDYAGESPAKINLPPVDWVTICDWSMTGAAKVAVACINNIRTGST